MNNIFFKLEQFGIGKTKLIILLVLFCAASSLYFMSLSTNNKKYNNKDTTILDSLYVQDMQITDFDSKILYYEKDYQKERKQEEDNTPNINTLTVSSAREAEAKVSNLQNKKNDSIRKVLNRLSEASNQSITILKNNSSPGGITHDPEYIALKDKINTRNNKNPTPPESKEEEVSQKNHLQNNLAAVPIASIGNLRKAVVHRTQIIKAGELVTLRTSEEIIHNNKIIPSNTLLNGIVRYSDNRLDINIKSIRINRDIINVNIDVYSSDGIKGLPISINNVNKEINKEITDETLGEINNGLSKLGTIGSVLGSVVQSSGRIKQRDKEIEVKLIDNQYIYLKFN